MSSRFSTIEAATAAMQRGEVIIVVDAEDRENEGDFICAAEKITPEIVNFMISHGRGQLCMPILPEDSERLDLAPCPNDDDGWADGVVRIARDASTWIEEATRLRVAGEENPGRQGTGADTGV